MSKTSFRKPYNYDGTRVTSHQIGDLLSAQLSKLGGVYKDRPDLLISAWPDIIGSKLAVMTQAVSFVNGVLTVKVRNSTLHSLLSRHDKSQILTTIRQKFPKVNVQNIVFRIG